MKIIDFHTHFYPDKIVKRAIAIGGAKLHPATDGTRAGLDKSMEQAGIALSVALPVVNTPANSKGVNAWAVSENHGNIHMLGSLHPREKHPEETLKFIADHGMRGIKLHPEYQDFLFSEEAFFPIWEKCAELGLFVLTHAGFDIMFEPPFKTDPEKILALHRRFPELTLVCAHLGGMYMWDNVEKYLAGEDVYLDLAYVHQGEIEPEQLLRIIRKHGANRILFGTDSPWCNQQEAVQFIDSLALTGDEKEQIFHGNAERLLQK